LKITVNTFEAYVSTRIRATPLHTLADYTGKLSATGFRSRLPKISVPIGRRIKNPTARHVRNIVIDKRDAARGREGRAAAEAETRHRFKKYSKYFGLGTTSVRTRRRRDACIPWTEYASSFVSGGIEFGTSSPEEEKTYKHNSDCMTATVCIIDKNGFVFEM